MAAFEFYCPTKIYFGKGAEARVGEAVKHFGGTKVFIVYGGHSAVKSGLIARIEQTLTDAGLEHMSFGGVQPTRACPTRARACRRRSPSARTSFSASAAAA